MTAFPTSLDALQDGVDTIEADDVNTLQQKVGIDGSAVTTSHDYKLSGVTGSDKAVSLAGTETLTNKRFTSPKINEDVVLTSTATELNLLDGITVLSGSNTGDEASASDSVAGVVELATTAETTTGTDTTRAVTPDGLAGSIYGKKIVVLKVIAEATALTTGDGKMYFTVTSDLNGMNLVDADAAVYTVSSSGTPTVQIHNLTDTQDMLSTPITIDQSEFSSYTAATPPVINATYDDVATGDRLRIDVDVAGTSTTGLDAILVFQTP